MSRMMFAAAAATLALASFDPALAQDGGPAQTPASQTPAAQAPAAEAPQGAPVMNPADQAFQDQGTAFEAETRQMGVDLQVVMEDDTLDNAAKTERTNAILDRYQPRFDAFAGVLKAYLTELANRPERTAEREQILAAAESAPAQLSAAPNAIRASIQQALSAPATPPAAADTPQ